MDQVKFLTTIADSNDPQILLQAAQVLENTIETEYYSKLKEDARVDLASFAEFITPEEIPAKHHLLMCDLLMRCESGETRNFLLSMPPGHAKSTYGSIYFAAWYLGRNPYKKFMQVGYNATFVENRLSKKVRSIITSEKYREVFPEIKLSADTKAAHMWALSNGKGEYFARGSNAGVAGMRANHVGIDDPYANKEKANSPIERDKIWSWFTNDLCPRMLPGYTVAVISTRWHSDDICGRIIQQMSEGLGSQYEIINLPAIHQEDYEDDPLERPPLTPLWPDYYDFQHLKILKSQMAASDWNSLYQGKPIDELGGVMLDEWLIRYKELPKSSEKHQNIRRITLSVDSAQKTGERHDFTAITVWIEGVDRKHYLADVVRKRMEFTEMSRTIDMVALRWGVHAILVEDRGSGTQYIQVKQGRSVAPIIPITTKNLTKEFRFDAVTPMFEAGEVLLPESAHWLPDYEAELKAFPFGSFDDQVDSTSQYLSWARAQKRPGTMKLKGTAYA